MAERTDHLRADALRYGADADEVDRAIAALRVPEHQVRSAVIDLGDRTVSISHPGRGHTGHDLIAVVTGTDRPVVFCGDLVEESGDPSIEAGSDPAAWPMTLERVIEAGGSRGGLRTRPWRRGRCGVHRQAARLAAQAVTNVNRQA